LPARLLGASIGSHLPCSPTFKYYSTTMESKGILG